MYIHFHKRCQADVVEQAHDAIVKNTRMGVIPLFSNL